MVVSRRPYRSEIGGRMSQSADGSSGEPVGINVHQLPAAHSSELHILPLLWPVESTRKRGVLGLRQRSRRLEEAALAVPVNLSDQDLGRKQPKTRRLLRYLQSMAAAGAAIPFIPDAVPPGQPVGSAVVGA